MAGPVLRLPPVLGAAGEGPVALDASVASGSVKGHELRIGVRGLLRDQLADELLVSVALAASAQRPHAGKVDIRNVHSACSPGWTRCSACPVSFSGSVHGLVWSGSSCLSSEELRGEDRCEMPQSSGTGARIETAEKRGLFIEMLDDVEVVVGHDRSAEPASKRAPLGADRLLRKLIADAARRCIVVEGKNIIRRRPFVPLLRRYGGLHADSCLRCPAGCEPCVATVWRSC
ncbi:hypothetical protein ACFPRL_04905 [Pseudoclavibacter helvolus]